MISFNQEIETTLHNMGVPISFMFYEGNADTYIVYQQIDKDNALACEDAVVGCVQYYDFDVYSKTNFLSTVTSLIDLMVKAGWTYQPSRDSPDFYEADTKYYHKTICLAKESEGITNG